VIETAQEIYEKEYQCRNNSLFIWQKNIAFYTQWLLEGFLPRKDASIPIPHGEKAESIVTPDDCYGYVKSYGGVLFLHKAEDKRAITLKDTYVRPDYDITARSAMRL